MVARFQRKGFDARQPRPTPVGARAGSRRSCFCAYGMTSSWRERSGASEQLLGFGERKLRGNGPFTPKEHPMIKMRLTDVLPIFPLLSPALLVAIPVPAFGQGSSVGVPEHASANRYGGGWTCARGYRESDGACLAVLVPDHAFATNKSYGPGWECNWGYREIEQACIAIKVPPNAYINSSGAGSWTCNRGYRAERDACVAIKVPSHGYLTDAQHGPGWRCDRGYRALKDACVALEIPENAHLDYSGNDWDCNEPYRKRDGKCTLM